MEKDKKRALRRHHEDRMKAKYRKVAIKFAGSINHWVNGNWVNGPPGIKGYEEWIQKQTAKLAHHHNHFCQMCRRPRYNRIYNKLGKNAKAFSY